MENNGKDFWDKLDIMLKPVGGLLTAAAVALLGFYSSSYLNRRQDIDTKARLYTELMSQREQSESALRKDMFVSIIEYFLKPESASVEAKVLNLELLAYNFHESLNLKPLFYHLQRQIDPTQGPSAKDYTTRLEKVAGDVIKKQLLVLETPKGKFDRTILLSALRDNPEGVTLAPGTLKLGETERTCRITVLKADPTTRELQLRLEILTAKPSADWYRGDLSVGFFDFPMVNNTRLSDDQRCAIVLNTFTESRAEITVVCFPGSHASLKEKPFYEDIIGNLQKQPAFGEGQR